MENNRNRGQIHLLGFQDWGANSLGGEDYAVGDIHGCFEALEATLASCRFDPSKDRLLAVGDLCDRGPQSPRALEFLAKPWFKSTMGNHDFMLLRHCLGDPYPAVDFFDHGGAWALGLSEAQKAEWARELSKLPLFAQAASPKGIVGFAHADFPFDDWAMASKAPSTQVDASWSLVDESLWGYERIERRYEGAVKGAAAVIHGHATLSAPLRLGNCHFIDTGGWRPAGSFTLLRLRDLKAL